jgi:hypothetical protein
MPRILTIDLITIALETVSYPKIKKEY